LGISLFNLLHVQWGFTYLNAGLLASLLSVLLSIVLAQPYSHYVDDLAIKVSNKLAKMF